MKELLHGMYWFYKGLPTETTVREAVSFYRAKYPSSIVTAIYANPSEVGELYNVDGLPVRPERTVIKGNLYISVSGGSYENQS
jgi:hypothetical protein